jgi:hypothetical protein
MKRRGARTVTIPFDELLAADEQLAKAHALWTGEGYTLTSARLWRRKDRTVTARVVWRSRAEPGASIVYTISGIVLR